MAFRTSIINTEQTALIRSFPWSNGVPLVSNRRDFLSDAWKNTHHPPTVVHLALTLADQVDYGAELKIDDPATYNAVSGFLGPASTAVEDARPSIVTQINPKPASSPANLTLAGNVVFRYRLLDLFADALSAPHPVEFSTLPRIPNPPYMARLDTVMAPLENWPRVIQTFCQLHETYASDKMVVDPSLSMSHQTNAQQIFLAGMQCLQRTHRLVKNKRYLKILYNIESLVCCVWWICMGFDRLPDDEASMLQSLCQHAKDIDMPEDTYQFLPQMISEIRGIVKSMQNTFSLAIAVSPLLLLVPNKLQLIIRRDVLIGYAMAVGSEKPLLLRDVEKTIWSCVFNMAANHETEMQIPDMARIIKEITLLDTPPHVVSWFHGNNMAQAALSQSSHSRVELKSMGSDSSSVTTQTSEDSDDEGHSSAVQHPDIHDHAGDVSQADNHNNDDPDDDNLDSDDDDDSQGTRSHTDNFALRNDVASDPSNTDDGDDDDNHNSDDAGKNQNHGKPKRRRAKPLSSAKIVPEHSDDGGPPPTTSRARQGRAPDLPLSFPTLPKHNTSDIIGMRSEKISVKGITTKFFFAESHIPPKEYEFKVLEKMAAIEHTLLESIQGSVENGYVPSQSGRRPPHHLDSARRLDAEPGCSAFFVTTPENFAQLSGEEVQGVFRDRHILIPHGSSKRSSFSREALAELGSLYAPREIQLSSQSPINSFRKSSHYGRLLDLLPGHDGKTVAGLSALNIPMLASSMPKPPRYNDLASTEYAWQEMRDMDGMMNVSVSNNGMVWASACTRDATSWVQIADQGMATVFTVVTGLTYLVTMFPKRSSDNDNLGDMGTTLPFSNAWSPSSPSLDIWDHEAVLLRPGDVFYMRPTTPHYILTVEDSIIHGRHLFPTSTIQSTVFGIVHSFIMSTMVMTPMRDNLFTLLRRLMGVWYSHYNQDAGFDAARNIHVPDMSTPAGLMDVMAIGNILELARVLDHRSYRRAGISQAEQHEMAVARWWYRKLQVLFTTQHITHVGGKPTAPLGIFRRSLVEFAAAVEVYKKGMDGDAPRIYGCSATGVSRRMADLFTANYPELSTALTKNIEEGHGVLYWTGPMIEIRRRDRTSDKWSLEASELENIDRPRLDFYDHRIFYTGPFDIWRPRPQPFYKGKQKGGASNLNVTADPNMVDPPMLAVAACGEAGSEVNRASVINDPSIVNDNPSVIQGGDAGIPDAPNSSLNTVPDIKIAPPSSASDSPTIADPPTTIDPALLTAQSGSAVDTSSDLPAGTKRRAPPAKRGRGKRVRR